MDEASGKLAGPSKLMRVELSSSMINKALAHGEESLDKRFEKVFELEKKGYDPEHVAFGKMLLGNLLGGIGYFDTF